MKYSEIKDFFANGNYDKLLEQYIPQFDIVDKYAILLQNGEVDNKSNCIGALNELTGVFMDVKKVVEIIESLKMNAELGFYVNKKQELEAKSEKVVATSLDKEASLSVAEYRRVRNIFDAYLSSAFQGIQSVQSILRGLVIEYNIESTIK